MLIFEQILSKMYIPPIFKHDNVSEIRKFISENGFGILINQVDGKFWGTHIPLILQMDEDGSSYLFGHVAKANKQWTNFQNDQEVMAIFTGPHGYISSSWYSKENVPTWNYAAVHIYGKIQILNQDELMNSLKILTNKYEHGRSNPVRVEGLSEKTLKQNSGLIGFKIKISEIQSARKLSQNRNKADHDNIIAQLNNSEDRNDQDLANEMKKDQQ